MIYCDPVAYHQLGECPCSHPYNHLCVTCEYPHDCTEMYDQQLKQALLRRQQEQMKKKFNVDLGGRPMKTIDTVSSYPGRLEYQETDSLATSAFALTQTEAECIVSLTSNAMAQKFGVSIMEVLPVIRATLQPYIR